ncbi:YMGG-like glycine zipper-containing protein [Roseobacter ponti]|uniref:17 kDa surface antigen n=1 Tax=Roseobacter ponti TaxID=1891787 RepID=A0A858SVK9_9RHOB|nr:glycine zipper 2TM domain-containing protein [Roseobacter ponti]QJF52774.1 glycine zipper 2TM domain-containing protein [Roseobacter ponti]
MKKLFIALPLVAGLSACATQDQSTLAGATAGAALGAAVNDGDRKTGAIVGGVAGALAGNYLGRTASGSCVYQNPDGTRYTAACP